MIRKSEGYGEQKSQVRCEREVAIVRFVAELLETSTVSDERYSEAKNALGDDSVLVEITSIVGYYTYCAYTLNVFNIPTKSTNDDIDETK